MSTSKVPQTKLAIPISTKIPKPMFGSGSEGRNRRGGTVSVNPTRIRAAPSRRLLCSDARPFKFVRGSGVNPRGQCSGAPVYRPPQRPALRGWLFNYRIHHPSPWCCSRRGRPVSGRDSFSQSGWSAHGAHRPGPDFGGLCLASSSVAKGAKMKKVPHTSPTSSSLSETTSGHCN